MTRPIKNLGEILMGQGLISKENLERALVQQEQTQQLLGRVLVDLGMVSESELMGALAGQIGYQFVDLASHSIDPNAALLLPEPVARKYHVLPIGYEDSKLVVAMADPANLFALDDIRTLTGMDVKPVVATAADIEMLGETVRKKVEEQSGVKLEWEIKRIGIAA